jgi:two-component system sensor histidine kinase HydH
VFFVGVLCLAVAVAWAYRDLDREKRNLEQLYVQKAELLIRTMSVAVKSRWIDEFNNQELANYTELSQDREVLYLATTSAHGDIQSASVDVESLSPENFIEPAAPSEFPPSWTPRFRTGAQPDGEKIFWVYRPMIYSLQPPHNQDSARQHHNSKRSGRREPPPWPPLVDFSDTSRAVYFWVGFDFAPFEAAASAHQRSVIILSILVLLALSAILSAFSWALKFAKSYAITNEIIARLPIGLILNDNLGKVVIVNQAAERISGLKLEDFQNKSLKDLTHGTFPEYKELGGLEKEVSFLNGLTPRLSITSGPVVGPVGGEIGRVVLFSDVGELNRLKAQLAEKDRLARLGGIASGLAHEIRNPLGAIKGLTQHLAQKSADEQDEQALRVILNCVERLARTINDFQAFALPVMQSERVELTELMKKLHFEMERLVATSNLSMYLNIQNENLTISGDKKKLYEAFKNIYLNAVEIMAKNPPERPGVLKVNLARFGETKAIVTISDNGPGFGEAQLKTPFVPYFTSKAQNTGLGLAKANLVIRTLKGQINLSNHLGGGALVTVTLPLENHVSPLRIAPLDLGAFLEEAHSLISYDSKSKNVAIDLKLPPTKIAIMADKDQIHQVVTNIYLNAIQAMEKNDSDASPHLTVTLSDAENGKVVLSFADNGPGFEDIQLEKPFMPFYTTKDEGTGLGLMIIKNIVEAHHGEIKLENRPGGGGLVTVILPSELS